MKSKCNQADVASKELEDEKALQAQLVALIVQVAEMQGLIRA